MTAPMNLSALRMYQRMYDIDSDFDRSPMRALLRDAFRQLAQFVETDLRDEAHGIRQEWSKLTGTESAEELEALRRSWDADSDYTASIDASADEIRGVWTDEVFERFLAHVEAALSKGGLGDGPWGGLEQVAFEWAFDNPAGAS